LPAGPDRAIITLTKQQPETTTTARDRPNAGFFVNEQTIIDAVLAGLSEFIDPPMTSGITIVPDDRLWIARRVAERVVGRVGSTDRDTD